MKSNNELIEVICVDMQCFLVDAKTLDPIGRSYYEPNAWTAPEGRKQMSFWEWNDLHLPMLMEKYTGRTK